MVPGRKSWSTVRGGGVSSPPLRSAPSIPSLLDGLTVDLEEFAFIVDILLRLPVLQDHILGVNTVNPPFTSVVNNELKILNACYKRVDSAHGFMHDLYNQTIADESKMGLDEEAMEEPLSAYYIRCSHNTYLPGNQVGIGAANQATEERYREVLSEGTRCVEIDSYGKRNVTVKHGSLSGTGSLARTFTLLPASFPIRIFLALTVSPHLQLTVLSHPCACSRPCADCDQGDGIQKLQLPRHCLD